MDKLSTDASIRKLSTSPNPRMIFSHPTIAYTSMTRHILPNVHCMIIWMKIEVTFYDAQMPFEDDGEWSS